jgi:hypothetical protein
MSLGRIRLTMSDDPQGQALLTAARAGQRVWSLLTSPRDIGMTGDVIVELSHDDGLSALLSELHMISPRVLVSSADQPPPLIAHPVGHVPGTARCRAPPRATWGRIRTDRCTCTGSRYIPGA